jgi:ABC-2 type transport system ATP-binding protein
MIELRDVSKSYKIKSREKKRKKETIKALDNVSLNVTKAETYGLIGPNGAGKTTLLKILSTLILPNKGSVTIDGLDVINDSEIVKTKIGLINAEFVRSLYWRLSGINNLKFFANLRNVWNPEERIEYLLELFDLKKAQDELVMKYSTGMKHKLAFAVSLLNNPSILFLDEPLTGMDPKTAFDIKNLIKTEFNDKTIIWASHNLFEIEEMCDRIGLINNGRIVLEGSSDKLKTDYWEYTKIIVVPSGNLKEFEKLGNVEFMQEKAIIKTKDTDKTFNDIFSIAKTKNIKLKEIQTIKPTLEDIFMKVVENAK